MAKLKLQEHFWTETAESVREQIVARFPSFDQSKISEGVLSRLKHKKEHYRLGFVFKIDDEIFKEFIYYPIIKAYFVKMEDVESVPVKRRQSWKNTRRGNMSIKKMANEKYAVCFERSLMVSE